MDAADRTGRELQIASARRLFIYLQKPDENRRFDEALALRCRAKSEGRAEAGLMRRMPMKTREAKAEWEQPTAPAGSSISKAQRANL